jgi:pyruvate/2-oxoglutarate dehydrogenase complex dihydrolipoamide acyltransferase (E2) component
VLTDVLPPLWVGRSDNDEVAVITKVVLPRSGMGIDEGKVLRWLKAIGDDVRRGDPLVEIETAKAVQEVEAPASGKLTKILFEEGQTAAVDAEIALIENHD